MKKQFIIGVFTLSLLLVTQVFWFVKNYNSQATEFDHKVSMALYHVADTISEDVKVEKKSGNYFYVNANSSATSKFIDTLIQKEFSARNLNVDYELGVFNAEDDSLVHAHTIKATASSALDDIIQKEDGVPKNFAVFFPARTGFLINSIDSWIPVLLVLVLFISSSVGNRIFKKDDNQNQIRFGSTCLDYHNQILIVNQNNYSLTYKENKILKLFFENPNEVVKREIFLEQIWEKDGFFVARSMDVFISRIRKYLHQDNYIKIENLRSIGYRLHVKK